MKQFFGAFFGSIVGILLATILAIVMIVAVLKASIGSAMQGREETEVVTDKALIRLDLTGELIERQRENPFRELGEVAPFVDADRMGLNVLLRKIRSATKDNSVKGIYLRFHGFDAGYASLAELRKALQGFRDSGKFIYSYADDYSQREYYLASVATRIYVHPEGSLEWKGLGMNLLFFKNALSRLDVDLQVFRHGKFKSAIEPIILDRMSEANREQSESFLNSIWNTMLADISVSRRLPPEELNAMADQLSIRFPEDAKGKLVDEIAYEDELHTVLKKKTGESGDGKLACVNIDDYYPTGEFSGKDGRIAVIYANGQITQGDGSDDEAGSDRLARALREARTDSKIRAIVLRVNSPGGSALASDIIWREVLLASGVKPTVVSMGDVAASGGYYISCAAHRIFAQNNSITGSIGVFGVLPNVGRMLENKLGITADTVNTNLYSDLGSGLRPVTAREQEFIQASVERVYSTFTGKVAQGRSKPQAEVDSIGQGRVWSGSEALRIGLVDEIGGLNEAVAYAAKKAGIRDYRVTELPKLKGPFDGLFNNAEKEVQARATSAVLGKAYPYFLHMKSLLQVKGVQARLPFDMVIE